jgi:catalase
LVLTTNKCVLPVRVTVKLIFHQLPVNAPLSPVANFQRDGFSTFVSQGARPNYMSTISPLKYQGRKGTAEEGARIQRHEQFIGSAYRDLSEVTECSCFPFVVLKEIIY